MSHRYNARHNVFYRAHFSVERVVHDIKRAEVNGWGFEGEDADNFPDESGWVWINRKRVPVQTGFRNHVMVWEVKPEHVADLGYIY
jgi:hypothetical protein